MQYFILGSTGYIGSYLYKRLKNDGYNVIGTSRRAVDDELIYYDIQSSSIERLLEKADKKESKVAIICIAESNINRCYENYEEAYDINVIKTKKLIKQLSENGFHVIYFSSDNVFDGEGSDYTENSQTHPINKYGMMKAEMEQYIMKYIPQICIFRIPKVVSIYREKQNVFTEWLEQIQTHNIRCIKGNIISFVCIEDLYQVCLIAAKNMMQGLYNIAGDQAYSRAQLAEMFYKELRISDVDIQECKVEEFYFKDHRPLNTSMSNIKFRSETGYQFMSMFAAIEDFIRNIEKTINLDIIHKYEE